MCFAQCHNQRRSILLQERTVRGITYLDVLEILASSSVLKILGTEWFFITMVFHPFTIVLWPVYSMKQFFECGLDMEALQT
jgi:hypothetical protein